MDKLFGIPMDQLLVTLVTLLLIGGAVMAVMGYRNRVAFRLGIRNIPRRKTQTILIVLGLMLATLLFSASFATGDTLTASIRQQALGEIGEMDEVVRSTEVDETGVHKYFNQDVAEAVRSATAEADEVQAVVPAIQSRVPVYSADSSLSEPGMTMLALPAQDPGIGQLQAASGPASGADAEPDSGEVLDLHRLTEAQAYLSADAAEALEAEVGTELSLFLGAQPDSLTVAGIYEGGGHAAGPLSMVVPLQTAQDLLGRPGSINQIMISNQGDAQSGARHTETVVNLVEPALSGTGLEVEPIKQDTLDVADEAGASFSTIFLLFAQFSVAAGILLIFLIFVMLAAERKHELGIARAVGAQRRHVVRMFTFEGSVYAVAAAAIGSFLGVAVGYTMVFVLRRAFSQMGQGQGSLDLTFAFNWQSVVIAFALGVLLTFVVVVASSWRVSRLNIVRAVRDIPEPRTHERTWRTLVTGIILPILGVLFTWSGAQSAQAGVFMLGISLVLVGLPLLARRFGLPERAAFTAAGVALLVWWLLPASVMEPIISDMEQGIEMFFISGIMLVLGGVWVVIYNSELLLTLIVVVFGRLRGAPPVLKTAVSYPMQSRFRTGMTLAMFSLVVFTLVVMSFIIAGMTQVFADEEAVSGGFEVRASVNPRNPVQDIRAEIAGSADAPSGTGSGAAGESGEPLDPESFRAVGTVGTARVDVRPAASEISPEKMTLQGADEGYTESVGYGFALRAPGYASDREVWRALQEEPDTAVIAYSLAPSRADYSMGGPEPPFKLEGFYAEDEALPSVQISVTDPLTEAETELTVIGVLEPTAIYAGNIMTSRSNLTRIIGRSVPPQLFWFDLAEDANADQTAKALERRFLPNGMQAVDTGREVRDVSATTVMINNLLQGFMALGLVVGIAALGVVAARSVVERRQEIGLMRAIGFQKGMVRNSFVVESSFIALLGILIGAGLGFALSPQIVDVMSDQIAGMTFTVPWKPILLIVGVAYGAALVTTIIPARQAARVNPADALRYE